MKIARLKRLLTYCLAKGRRKAMSSWSELADQIFVGSSKEIASKEVSAYEVNGTLVLVSDSAMSKPKRIAFVDLMNKNAFMQEIDERYSEAA